MVSQFWKASMRDKVKNGCVLGILFSITIIWGEGLYDWLLTVIPANWQTFAGDMSAPLIILATGAIIGYLIDRY